MPIKLLFITSYKAFKILKAKIWYALNLCMSAIRKCGTKKVVLKLNLTSFREQILNELNFFMKTDISKELKKFAQL